MSDFIILDLFFFHFYSLSSSDQSTNSPISSIILTGPFSDYHVIIPAPYGVQIYSFYFLFPQSFSYNTNVRLLSLVPSLLDAFLEAPIHSSLFNTNLKE
jgi:hypothetical protein